MSVIAIPETTLKMQNRYLLVMFKMAISKNSLRHLERKVYALTVAK